MAKLPGARGDGPPVTILIDLKAKDTLVGAAACTRSVRVQGIGGAGKPRAETLDIRSLNNAMENNWMVGRGRKGREAYLGCQREQHCAGVAKDVAGQTPQAPGAEGGSGPAGLLVLFGWLWGASLAGMALVPVAFAVDLLLMGWLTAMVMLIVRFWEARLLHRTTRQVRLAADGAQLLERVRLVLVDAAEIDQLFLVAQRKITGRLHVDVPSRIARRLVAPAQRLHRMV